MNYILNQSPEVLVCTKYANEKIILQIYVQPNASRTEIIGIHDQALKVRVAAPAVEDKANTVLCDFLAKEFAVPKKNVEVTRGHTSRNKTVVIILK